jgi:hypothetical protein
MKIPLFLFFFSFFHLTPTVSALELLGNPLAASFIACLDRERSAALLLHVVLV